MGPRRDGYLLRAGSARPHGALSDTLADTSDTRAGGRDPGRVLRDLALTVAYGGDCLADLGALRHKAAWLAP